MWIGILGIALVCLGVMVFMWKDRLFPGPVMNKTEQHTYARSLTNLKIDTESGDVSIRAGQSGQVSVERQFTWTGAAPTFTEEWEGEQLRITVSVQQESSAMRRIQAQAGSGNVVVQYPQN